MTANAEQKVAYVNARLLDPASGLDRPGGLLSAFGLIADLGPDLFAGGTPEGADIVDCQGQCLCPGLIDMHAHLREPGEEHKETLASAGRSAAAGGITTIICLPTTDPVIDNVALVDFIAKRARETAVVNILAYAALTKGLGGQDLTEMGALSEAGAVGFTDGDVAVSSTRVMLRAMRYARNFDLLVVQHPEDPTLAEGGSMNSGEMSTRLGLSGIPAAAEVILIERDLRLLEATGGRYHVAHISTAAAIEAVHRAKARGLDVSCAAAAHHFALNEMAIGDYRTFAKVSPPLRGEDDRCAVVEGLADGTIDAITSDHSPHDQDSKRVPFAQAAYGIIGFETLLPLALELYHGGRLSLIDVIGKMTAAPAARLGLPCGRLAAGAPADMLLFDADRPWRVDVDAFRSKSRNSPFDGRPVQGLALRTIVGGRTVFSRDD